MKILFISPYTPNLIRVRPYQIICALTRGGHAVTLATLWTSAAEQANLQALREQGVEVCAHPLSVKQTIWNSLAATPSRSPIQASFCWQPALASELSAVVQTQRFDAIHVEHLRGARYGLHVQTVLNQRQRNGRPPIVWDSVDCISYLFKQAAQQSRSLRGRLMTWLELGRTRRYEGQLVRQFDQVLASSPTDAQTLDMLAGMADKVQVLPNGVDLDYFRPTASSTELTDPTGLHTLPGPSLGPPTLIFSGKMSYHANITAALHLVQNIMPLVWTQRPDVQVRLVGKDPPPVLRNLTNVHPDSDGTPRVVVTGTVPELRSHLQQAALAVAPVLYGAGIQNKVLEAMACAKAVVASPQAASGLRSQGKKVVRMANNPADFAQAILALLADAPRRRELGQAGRCYVEEWHSWDRVGVRLEELYLQRTGQRVAG